MPPKDEIFVAIVEQTSPEAPTWHGVLRFDKSIGYTGKLIRQNDAVTNLRDLMTAGTPASLDKDALHCLLDQGQYATLLWPRVNGWNIHGAGATAVNVIATHLIEDVHLSMDERDITAVTLQSDLFCRLFGLVGISQEIEFSPLRVEIKSAHPDPLRFTTSIGNAEISVAHSLPKSNSDSEQTLQATGHFKLTFAESVSILECNKTTRIVEEFMSLACFSYVKSNDIRLTVTVQTREGPDSLVCQQKRAMGLAEAKLTIEPHKMPIRVSQEIFSKAFNCFLADYPKLTRSLRCYRMVTTESRYIEDKYFYAVRMIESFHTSFGERDVDQDGLDAVEKIAGILKKQQEDTLVSFVESRIKSVFSRPFSLGRVILRLKTTYSSVLATSLLDEKLTTKLRHQEAHGNASPYSSRELEYMSYSTKLLRMLFVCLVLERIGFEKGALLKGLERTHPYSMFFSASLVEEMQNVLREKSSSTSDQ